MEFQKIVNFLDTTSDNKDLPKFVNGVKTDNSEDLDVVMPM